MHTHHILEELANGFSAAAVGQDFFQLLAEHLSKALQVDYVFIGEFDKGATDEQKVPAGYEKIVRSHVFLAKGQKAEAIQYPLVGSLCEHVANSGFCAFPSQVQQQFPENQALKHFGVDSYVGIALFDAKGRESGIIYVMHRDPVVDLVQTEYLLKIVAKRVELELERVVKERELRETNEKLQQANEKLEQELMQRRQVEIHLRGSEAELRVTNQELQAARDSLAALNEQLEQRVEARTEALHSATLRITQVLEGEKAAREEAQAQRRLVEDLFMQAPVAIAICQADGFVVELANQKMMQVWGTNAPIAGKPLFEALPNLEGIGYRERLVAVLATGNPYVGEEVEINRMREGRQERFFLDIVHQPLPDAKGGIARIITVAHEVTGQVEARRQVEASQAQLQRILSAIPDAVFSLDEQLSQVQFLSPAVSELLEEPLAALYQQPAYFLGKLLPFLAQTGQIPAMPNQQGQYRAEHKITTRQGQEKWVVTRLWLTEEVTAEGTLQRRVNGISSDITGQKRAQFALERREKRLSSLVESQTNYLIRTDLEGKYTFVNEQFLTKYGFRADQLLGQPYFLTVHPEDIGKCQQMALDCITNPGKVVPLELRKLIDGQLYYTEWEFIGIAGQNGQVEEIQGVGQDITSRKQAEEERQELIADLLRKNRDLEQFAFITSHNLRAPVANLLGLAALYNRENPSDAFNLSVIDNVTLSAQRLDEVIRDLNELLAVRKREEEQQLVELTEVVDRARLSLAAQLDRSQADLRVNLTAAPVVYAVRSYLQSIILNLLSNALKYRHPHRLPQIEITSYAQEGYVVLAVRDNGLGIDLARYGSKLFGLYKRFHTHTEGKGLGLHLVKMQAEAMGGKVAVESQPGEGSTFRVYFTSHHTELQMGK